MIANVDYIGILNLLRQLVKAGACTDSEAKRIAGRIAREMGTEVLFPI